MPSIGYLGPRGTFTQEALEDSLAGEFDEEVPYSTVPEVLQAVQSGEVDSGIVPIENSIEGAVSVTLDTLAFETDLVIKREVVHPVRHRLLARPGVKRREITGIVSHPQATAQCRGFLARWFGEVPVTAANSTAEAALAVSRSSEPIAAIAPELAADIYGLEVLDRDMEDHAQNVTRFVVVGKQKAAPHRQGQDIHRVLHTGEPPREPPRDTAGVRLPRDKPDQDRIAPHEEGAGRVLLLHRHRGPRGGPGDKRGRRLAGGDAPRAQAPRLLPSLNDNTGVRSLCCILLYSY